MKKAFTFFALGTLSFLSADPYYQYGGSSNSSVRDNYNSYQQQPTQYNRQPSYNNQPSYYDQQQPQYYDQYQNQYQNQNQPSQQQQNWNRSTQQGQDYQRSNQYDRRESAQYDNQQYRNQNNRQSQAQDHGDQQNKDYYVSDDAQPAVSDQELIQKVRAALKSGWFSKGYEGLTVNIHNGQVVISGQVESIEDKNKILEKIKEINGVKRVTANIGILGAKTNGDRANSESRSKAEELRNKYPKDRAATPADRDLQAKVRDKISGGWFGKENETIVLVTENGIVTISGTVDRVEDIDNYNKKIKEVDGVKEIRNNLKLKQN